MRFFWLCQRRGRFAKATGCGGSGSSMGCGLSPKGHLGLQGGPVINGGARGGGAA